MTNEPMQDRRHVVIVGGGFGGLAAARELRNSKVRVTLVDRRNYHLFQPLLYQVATAGLSPANIAAPLRYILRRQGNTKVLLADVRNIDVGARKLILADGEVEFDDLIIAAGSTHSYFGNDQWEQVAPGLKTIEDATTIRRHIFLAFEAAEREPDPAIRDQLMTFVVVGGGPTGVEMAGAISEISKHTLRHDFRNIDPADARILLIEAAPHVLAHYPEDLSKKAVKKIRQLGIEVHTHTKVTDIDDHNVKLSGPDGESTVASRTVLWAAGVKANPLGKCINEACGVEGDRAGRVPVTPRLNVEGHEHIFVIGDMAMCLDEAGKPLPGLAPVAIQQGQYVAKLITASTTGSDFKQDFRYSDHGSMATIGRAAAVAKVGNYETCGFIAWLLWLAVHLMQIVQFENRILILMQWAWLYITFNRSARLITGHDDVIVPSQQENPCDDPITTET